MDHPQKGRLDLLVAIGDRKHPVGVPVDEPAQPTWTGSLGGLVAQVLAGRKLPGVGAVTGHEPLERAGESGKVVAVAVPVVLRARSRATAVMAATVIPCP